MVAWSSTDYSRFSGCQLGWTDPHLHQQLQFYEIWSKLYSYCSDNKLSEKEIETDLILQFLFQTAFKISWGDTNGWMMASHCRADKATSPRCWQERRHHWPARRSILCGYFMINDGCGSGNNMGRSGAAARRVFGQEMPGEQWAAILWYCASSINTGWELPACKTTQTNLSVLNYANQLMSIGQTPHQARCSPAGTVWISNWKCTKFPGTPSSFRPACTKSHRSVASKRNQTLTVSLICRFLLFWSQHCCFLSSWYCKSCLFF